MSRLIESIHLHDGKWSNLEGHESRMARAWLEIFGIKSPWKLSDKVRELKIPDKGLYKCRVIYDESFCEISLTPYTLRPIRSLKLVTDNAISYHHKFEDRSSLDRLFLKRDSCDDILIVKDGLVTDTSYSNIVFTRENKWFTPESCLLPGTMRQLLIDQGKIIPVKINVADVHGFEAFKLINAMLQWDSDEAHTSGIIS